MVIQCTHQQEIEENERKFCQSEVPRSLSLAGLHMSFSIPPSLKCKNLHKEKLFYDHVQEQPGLFLEYHQAASTHKEGKNTHSFGKKLEKLLALRIRDSTLL